VTSDARAGLRAARPAPSLAKRAYQALREEILRGQLRPGTPLSRRRLADELRMSVIPVTEALQHLERDGLVESRPRAGTRVRVPTEQDVRELYEVREALETQSARLFTVRADDSRRQEIRRMAEQVDVLFGRLGSESEDAAFRSAVHSYHVQFHMRIAEHAGCASLKRLLERSHVLTLNWLFDVSARHTPLPARFHRDLGEAVASGDPERADAAMRAHVRYGLVEIADQVRRLAGSTEWREPRSRPARRRKLAG
jgi:GntR family transcriptional regulator, rspAB operon transcriptional repressor